MDPKLNQKPKLPKDKAPKLPKDAEPKIPDSSRAAITEPEEQGMLSGSDVKHEDMKESNVVADPHTKELVKAGSIVVFRSIYSSMKIPVYVPDRHGTPSKVYCSFREHSFMTSEPKVIKALGALMADEAARNIPLKMRKVLTEEEYDSIVSPEKLYYSYNGKQIHITDVRKGLAVAEKHGWVPEEKEILHDSYTKHGRVSRGAVSAAAGK